MYLPDNIQTHFRNANVIGFDEAVLKEGDLYVAVNVVNQQRRIISVDHQLIESMMKNPTNPGNKTNSGGLLKG